jgi:uncharacterized protein YutE (UPF0331/DUF86 family)
LISAHSVKPLWEFESGDHDILEKEFARSFAGIAGFRNFLAHDYDPVDAQIICRDVLAKLPEVKIFLLKIERALNV